jgi:hypothetical protein
MPNLQIDGGSAQRIPTAVNLDYLDPERLLFHSSSSSAIYRNNKILKVRCFDSKLSIKEKRHSSFRTLKSPICIFIKETIVEALSIYFQGTNKHETDLDNCIILVETEIHAQLETKSHK